MLPRVTQYIQKKYNTEMLICFLFTWEHLSTGNYLAPYFHTGEIMHTQKGHMHMHHKGKTSGCPCFLGNHPIFQCHVVEGVAVADELMGNKE